MCTWNELKDSLPSVHSPMIQQVESQGGSLMCMGRGVGFGFRETLEHLLGSLLLRKFFWSDKQIQDC